MSAANKGGSRPSGSRARSVGAAGMMTPNGAILNSDDSAAFLRRRKYFDDWAKDKRDLKPNRGTESSAAVKDWFSNTKKRMKG